jgi:glutathionylspermidine synthase
MLYPIRKLNRSYLDHLRENPERTLQQLELLNRFLVQRKCTFRDVAMPTLLKPNFISQKQTRALVATVEKMSVVLDKFVRYYLENEEVRRIMKFPERENKLFQIEPGYNKPLVISRLDAFLNDYSIKFLEFNCDSPAGIAYSDVLEEGFLEIFREYPFMGDWTIQSMKRQKILLDSLLECYRQFRSGKPGMPEKPVIAIVDWKDVSTYSEFQMHEQYFGDAGYETLIASPQDFTINNGRATVNGRQVDLVYRRVITRELVEKWEETAEFVECIGRGLVCCCNSFRSYIVGNKKVLALITDPRFQEIYSRKDLQVIHDTIPWTKILADSEAEWKGKKVQLKSFVLENREKLVMKPANMYGGKDVYIGNGTDAGTWEKILEEHIRDETWVVQEYVNIPSDTYPDTGSQLSFKDKFVNINPFALLGKYSGTITRVSDHPVINVSAGGGLVSTFTARSMPAG